jgi:hypothetical protein
MPAPVVAPPPAPATSNVDQGVIEDANAGAAWLMPTALTPPAGTWSFSDFQLLLASFGYAVSDSAHVSGTFLIPITKDFPFVGFLTGKLQVVRAGSLRIAGQAAVAHMREHISSSSTSTNDFSATIFDIGGAATLCIDDACHSHLSGYVAAAFSAQNDTKTVPLLFSGALVAKINRRVKFVAEVDSAAVVGGNFNDTADGALVWYGLRFTSREIGVDLGFVKPVYSGASDFLLIGYPFVSFTYRSLRGE